MLSNATKANLFILGDTSYGRFLLLECLQHSICTVDPFLYNSRSCCVDEVAAEHVQADCIIHFGPACLTQYVNRESSVIVYSVCDFGTATLKIFPETVKTPSTMPFCNCHLLCTCQPLYLKITHEHFYHPGILGQDGFQCSMCLDRRVLMYFTVWPHLGSSILTERQTYWCSSTLYTSTV